MQKHTSKSTSVNGTQNKAPALYNELEFKGVVVDYGCGNNPELLKSKANGAEWYGYDPYWNDDKSVLERLEKGVDLSVCCNVLNVIDDIAEIKRIIKLLVEHSREVVFQIYEGKGNNIGAESMNDCWQRNEKKSKYVELINSLGYKVTKHPGKFIYVKGEC